MYPWGDADRPPIRISHHSQAYLHAGAEGAVRAMLALHHRHLTGKGRHVDVSIHDSVVRTTYIVTASWDMTRTVVWRGGPLLPGVNVRMTRMWPCQDGYVMWFYFTAARRWNVPTVEFIDSVRMADDFLKGFGWRTMTQEVVDRWNVPRKTFFLAQKVFPGTYESRAIGRAGET